MNDLNVYKLAKCRLEEIYAEAAISRLANRLRRQQDRRGNRGPRRRPAATCRDFDPPHASALRALHGYPAGGEVGERPFRCRILLQARQCARWPP